MAHEFAPPIMPNLRPIAVPYDLPTEEQMHAEMLMDPWMGPMPPGLGPMGPMM